LQFIIGTVLVLLSTYLYTGPERKRGRPPPISIVSFEKATVVSTPKIVDQEKLNTDPLINSVKAMGLSTSRPSSPHLGTRLHSARGKKLSD
jgi:solute carrier family 35 (UDP-sugar transporter), member A1/2/3